MADPKLTEILAQGVATWNKWRGENSGVIPDLSGANLRKADLHQANLSNANLIGTDLSRANLIIVDLSGADLNKADLSDANLIRADLNKAYLIRANLRWADLSDANLSGANLRKADLHQANLSNANLIGTDLRWADLSDAELHAAYLTGADLSNANLSGAEFRWAILDEANLSEAYLFRADLSEADLSKANLSKANLSWANMTKTDLSYADISGANITGANLYDWKIEGIKCTQIIWNNKNIDYENLDDFEITFTQLESVFEILLDLPFSELSYLTGRAIEQASNNKYGKGSLLLKGQTAVSNDITKIEYLSFLPPDGLAEIKEKMSQLRKELKPVIEEAKAKEESKSIIGIKDQIDIPFTLGAIVIRPKELERVMLERYCQMNPLLHTIIQTIQLHIN